MATWQAKCYLGSANGYQELTVQSNTFHGAKEQLERIYGATQVLNLREVRQGSGDSGSNVDVGGTFALIAVLGAVYLFVIGTPWFLMGLGGALGGKIGSFFDDDSDGAGALILVLALLGGGIGFWQGDMIHKEYFHATVEEIRNAE